MPPHPAVAVDIPVGHGGVGNGHDGVAGGAGVDIVVHDQDQIDGIGEALVFQPERLHFRNKSNEHIAYARAKRSAKILADKCAIVKSKLAASENTLTSICSVVKDASKLIGRPSVVHIARRKTTVPDDFLMLVRAVHLPQNSRLRLMLDV